MNHSNLDDCEEKSFQVFRTLFEDERCKPLTFLSRKIHLNKTLLVSYPGSGNTWIRHLIEQASGIYSGSIYGDIKLYTGGKFFDTILCTRIP